jgi:hypothetical protein
MAARSATGRGRGGGLAHALGVGVPVVLTAVAAAAAIGARVARAAFLVRARNGLARPDPVGASG